MAKTMTAQALANGQDLEERVRLDGTLCAICHPRVLAIIRQSSDEPHGRTQLQPFRRPCMLPDTCHLFTLTADRCRYAGSWPRRLKIEESGRWPLVSLACAKPLQIAAVR